MAQLTLGRKISYASGGLAMNLCNLVISQWLFLLYAGDAQHPLVPAALFGAFMLLGRVTDAVTDPLIGYWSDRASYRRGRRIPFILWGTLPFAAVFTLLWTPPVAQQHWLNTVYVVLLIQLYFVLYTIVNTPYVALLPEITTDQDERINLSTLQAVFVMVGTVVFGVTGLLIDRGGWLAMGLAVSALMLLSYLPTALFIRERPRLDPALEGGEVGLGWWLRTTLRNRAFLRLAVSTSLYWFALNLMIMLVPFWVQDVLGRSKDAVTLLMAPFLGSNLVFFVVFNLLAKRAGKRAAFLATLLGSALTMPLVAGVGLLPWGSDLAQTAVVMAMVGVPVAGFLVLPFAILADVADQDERDTGRRREAIYFGVQAIFQKSAVGLSIFAFGLLVGLGSTWELAGGGLRIIAGVAGTASLLGFFVFLGYPVRGAPGR